jgi:hypothetical protein
MSSELVKSEYKVYYGGPYARWYVIVDKAMHFFSNRKAADDWLRAVIELRKLAQART